MIQVTGCPHTRPATTVKDQSYVSHTEHEYDDSQFRPALSPPFF
jgi:hypothetical protein